MDLNPTHPLAPLGWSAHFEQHFEPFRDQGFVPARVAIQHKDCALVLWEQGELTATLAGRLRHEATCPADLPVVGDWVAVSPRADEGQATIHALLPRRSSFRRKAAGSHTEEQILCANIDTAFLVSGLDGDFNPRRIERYLTVVWDSGATPVVVLNKTDLCPDTEALVEEVEAVAFGVPVLAVSAADNRGIDTLMPHLGPGRTAAFLGSSGVGKSTLINRLLGDNRLDTASVRADDSRGRHTTTHRELLVVPDMGIVIDTPGIRELQLWGDEDSLSQSFDDIERLAEQCRFRDCSHGDEPGCAVRRALEDGTLDSGRWESYKKLLRELRFLERRQDQRARLAERSRWKKIAKDIRKHYKNR
ncbi:ribosome small subunit-dependent GTPase A [bacterium]|nr:ribosome small subunit-dependent GTPase A [bacterium]